MSTNPTPPGARVIIYVARRDLRICGNAILLEANKEKSRCLLPVYVFSTDRMDVSGLIPHRAIIPNPYPAVSRRFGSTQLWPCGPHQAAFVAESVWTFRKKLQAQGNNLLLRVGRLASVIEKLVRSLGPNVAVWMAAATGQLEQREEAELQALCARNEVPFRLFRERTLIADTYKNFEEAPYGRLPPFPHPSMIPIQEAPFEMPKTMEALVAALQYPYQPMLRRLKHEWADRLDHHAHEMHLGTTSDPAEPDSMQRPQGSELEGRLSVRKLVFSESMRTCGPQAMKAARPEAPLPPALFAARVGAYLTQGCTTAASVRKTVAEKEKDLRLQYRRTGGGPVPVFGMDIRYLLLQRDYARACFSALGEAAVQSNSQREKMRKESYGMPNIIVRYLGDDENTIAVQDVLNQLVRADTGLAKLDQALREVITYGMTRVEHAPEMAARFLFQRKGVCWTHAARFFTSWLLDGDEAFVWTLCKHAATSREDRPLDPDLDGSYLRTFLPGAVPEKTKRHLLMIQAVCRHAHEKTGYYRDASSLALPKDNDQTNQQTAVSSTNASLDCLRHRMRTVWPLEPQKDLVGELMRGRCQRKQAPVNFLWYRNGEEKVFSMVANALEEILQLALPTHELVRVTVNSNPGEVDRYGLDEATKKNISKFYATQLTPKVSTTSEAWKAGWLMAESSLELQAEALAAAASPPNPPAPTESDVPELVMPPPSAGSSFSIRTSNPYVPPPAEAALVPGTMVDEMYAYMPPHRQYMGNVSPARVNFFWSFRRGMLARYAAERETVRLRTEAARIRNLGCRKAMSITTCTPGAVPEGLQVQLQCIVGKNVPLCFASTWTERLCEQLARALPPTWTPSLDGVPAVHVFLPFGRARLDRILRDVTMSVTWVEDDDMNVWGADWEGTSKRVLSGNSKMLVVNHFDRVATFRTQLPESAATEWYEMTESYGLDASGSESVREWAEKAAEHSAAVRVFGLPESKAPGPTLRIELWHDGTRLWAGLAHKGPMPLNMATESFFFLSPAFHAVVDKAFERVTGGVWERPRTLETAVELAAARMAKEDAQDARDARKAQEAEEAQGAQGGPSSE